MGRPKGSKNKPRMERYETPEDKSALEKEVILQRRKAVARKKAGKPAEVYNLIKDYDAENAGPPKGNPVGHCKDCGCDFEQPFSEDRNAYASWRICPECRKKRSERQTERIQKKQEENGNETEVSVATLPYTPYEWQKEAEEAFWNHRFTVLACGNRSGYYAPCIK